MKRTRLKPISDKRRAQSEERREVVAAVVARDGRCQLFPLLCDYMQISRTDLIKYAGVPRCDLKPLTAHEPGHSRNVGRLNPEESIAMCWRHNGWLEDLTGIMREHAYGAGLLRRANGDPIRKNVG